jgi:membrane-associated phospholipid phosphatase
MLVRNLFSLTAALGFCMGLWGQSAPDLSAPPQQPSQSNQSSPTAQYERPVRWRTLIPNIADDQKRIWLFPTQPVRGKHWVPTLAVLATTAALIAADPHTAGYFRRTDSFHGFNSVMTGNNTSLGIVLVPVSLYATGYLRKNVHAQHTALLAGEAIANAEIFTTVMKDLDRRIRPADLSPNANFADTWGESKGNWLRGNGSFPSGHTIAAFSVATVISRRYSNHRWVPYVAYGLAAAVGFSRMTLSSHFPSDVFMGAALGYSISRFAVLRQ